MVQSLVFHYNRNVTGTSAFGALALVEVVLEASYCFANIENLHYIAEFAISRWRRRKFVEEFGIAEPVLSRHK